MRKQIYKKLRHLVITGFVLVGCSGLSHRAAMRREKYFYYPQGIRHAIDKGFIVEGMDSDQVYLSLGDTSCKASHYYKGRQTAVWSYDSDLFDDRPTDPFDCQEAKQRVYFEDGRVIGWDNIDLAFARTSSNRLDTQGEHFYRDNGQFYRDTGQFLYNGNKGLGSVNLIERPNNKSQEWVVAQGVMVGIVDIDTFEVNVGGITRGIRLLDIDEYELGIIDSRRIKKRLVEELIGRKVFLRHQNTLDGSGRLLAQILYVAGREE